MFTLLACSWLLSADADAAPTPAMPAPFTAARFRQHVAYLASDELEGRNVGSTGSTKAMQYLVRHFQEAGLKGLASDELEGQDDWYQEFPFSFAQGGKKVAARNVLAVFPGRG